MAPPRRVDDDLPGFSVQQRERVASILAAALAEQADAFAFTALKGQVDRLDGVTERLEGVHKQMLTDLGNQAERLERHESQVHGGAKTVLAQLGLDRLSPTELARLPILLQRTSAREVVQAEREEREEARWKPWQLRGAMLVGGVGLLTGLGGFVLALGKALHWF